MFQAKVCSASSVLQWEESRVPKEKVVVLKIHSLQSILQLSICLYLILLTEDSQEMKPLNTGLLERPKGGTLAPNGLIVLSFCCSCFSISCGDWITYILLFVREFGDIAERLYERFRSIKDSNDLK